MRKARGFEQTEGVDYHVTFAPVVKWTTVQFLLIHHAYSTWKKDKKVDHVFATIVQSDTDTESYVEMTRCFADLSKFLKLKKSFMD